MRVETAATIEALLQANYPELLPNWYRIAEALQRESKSSHQLSLGMLDELIGQLEQRLAQNQFKQDELVAQALRHAGHCAWQLLTARLSSAEIEPAKDDTPSPEPVAALPSPDKENPHAAI